MELNYKTFKEIVNRAEIFLPYSFLLRELIAAKKIKKLSRFSLSDSTILEYTGASFVDDLKAIKKDYYVVSSFNENLPEHWMRFNDVISEVSMQCKKSIVFYIPYYDLSLPSYFVDLVSLSIKKKITLYAPEKEYKNSEPELALKKFKEIGFECVFARGGEHAKVYLFDDKAALVGSFNFTKNAAYKNRELGVLLFGDEVKKLQSFMEQ